MAGRMRSVLLFVTFISLAFRAKAQCESYENETSCASHVGCMWANAEGSCGMLDAALFPTVGCAECSNLMVGQPEGTLCHELLLNSSFLVERRMKSIFLDFDNTKLGNIEDAKTYVESRVGIPTRVRIVQIALSLSVWFSFFSFVFYIRAIWKDYRKKRKLEHIKTLEILLAHASFGIFLLNFSALYVLFAGSSRRSGVKGVPGLRDDDYCTLNSEATVGCEVQSFLYAFAIALLSSSISCCGIQLYCTLGKNLPKSQVKAFLPRYLIYTWSVTLIVPAVAHGFAPHGPMGAYCGMRCAEYGFDEGIATNILMVINGSITVGTMAKVAMKLRAHAAKTSVTTNASESTSGNSKKRKKKNSVKQAQRKLINFAMAVGVLEFLAFFIRLPTSIKPNEVKEGVVSITEWIPVMASIANYVIFGVTKAPWGPYFNPFSKDAIEYRKGKRNRSMDSTDASSGGSSGGNY